MRGLTVGEPVVNCYTGPTDCPQPCDCATSAWQSAPTKWQAWEEEEPKPAPHMTCDGQPDKPACDSFFGQGTDGSFATLVDTSIQGGPAPGEGPGESNFCRMNGMEPPCTIIHYVGPESNECSSPNPVTNVWDSSMTNAACHRYTKWNYDNRCTALASGKYADIPGGAKRENGLFKKVDTNQIFDGYTAKLKECEDFTVGEPVVNCYTGPTDCPQPCDCATSAWQSAETESGGDEDVGDGDGEGLTCFVPNDTSFDVSITCSDIAVRSVGCYSDNDCGTGSTCSFERKPIDAKGGCCIAEDDSDGGSVPGGIYGALSKLLLQHCVESTILASDICGEGGSDIISSKVTTVETIGGGTLN